MWKTTEENIKGLFTKGIKTIQLLHDFKITLGYNNCCKAYF